MLALMRWVSRMDAVGTVLMVAVQRIRHRRAAGDTADEAPARHDVDRAWALLRETLRWTRVLLLRLWDDIEAEKAALMQAPEVETAAIETLEALAAELGSTEPVRATQRAQREPDPDRAIKCKSVTEIVEQICADLGAAATLLGETDLAREVVEIAQAVRALLDGAVGVEAEPAPATGVRPAVGVGPAMLPAADTPVRAPDSG
jgi:hypothetical protein